MLYGLQLLTPLLYSRLAQRVPTCLLLVTCSVSKVQPWTADISGWPSGMASCNCSSMQRTRPSCPCPGAQVRVLLCSTKAGGVGLNLTCASRVILIDVWWNSAPEDQVGSPAEHQVVSPARPPRKHCAVQCLSDRRRCQCTLITPMLVWQLAHGRRFGCDALACTACMLAR
jgi:hypothetical protein